MNTTVFFFNILLNTAHTDKTLVNFKQAFRKLSEIEF